MLKTPGKLSKAWGQPQLVEIPGPPLFRGNKKTIRALHHFIEAVQGQAGEHLTARHRQALTTIAEAIIAYIEAGFTEYFR